MSFFLSHRKSFLNHLDIFLECFFHGFLDGARAEPNHGDGLALRLGQHLDFVRQGLCKCTKQGYFGPTLQLKTSRFLFKKWNCSGEYRTWQRPLKAGLFSSFKQPLQGFISFKMQSLPTHFGIWLLRWIFQIRVGTCTCCPRRWFGTSRSRRKSSDMSSEVPSPRLEDKQRLRKEVGLASI